ncbi:50S ribosomal protein L11 methyltransferase [Flavisolibacter ginsenosidimutans]|uniref:Ribosomal protein L11 methyltransferase n=1 Tax=Flavisolibacter ginsenosidimutans TaxID=661481 RepID=A0A5B8UE68_9BACT|nr:50S ribosomal protein L11 methyltransferase [Flavisolibacter ginsenosidimutans]QEC54981.1 50S ribosomal protein L11 methyltransferase [Flavisolibacter ginsenosidimutans]
MKHVKLEIIANEYQQEELIALLDDYNPSGFEQTDEKLVAYFSEEGFAKDDVLKILEGYSFVLGEVEEKNWNEEWERNFKPVVVGDFVAVRADFHQPVNGVQHEIVITPKMSFGTGHHATTHMMMQQMRVMDFTDKIVFDFGTGTGILSILAEKLGAAKIIAIDVDEWSMENANENIERNGCSKITASLSSQIPTQQFDVILANINRNVILDYLPFLVKALHLGAVILFSGLLIRDEQDIKATAEQNGLILRHRSEKQGWLSLLFVNGQ